MRASFSALIVAVVLASVLPGCGPNAPASGKPPEAIVGAWIEVRGADPGISPRVANSGSTDPNYRKFTFNADKTFLLSFVDQNGQPQSPELTAKGTWSVKDSRIRFTVTENKLGEKYASWLPDATQGVRDAPSEAGPVERMTILDVGESNCYLKRAN